MKNITQEDFFIDKANRNKVNQHHSFFILFTGFSGSGKTTLSNALEQLLFQKNIKTYCLDGDNVRFGLNKDLGFSPEDRAENLRRIAEMAKLFVDAGLVTLASFVAPYEADRAKMKQIVGADCFFEIHVSTSIQECERRDVKGLYAKVRAGEIKNFTGIDAPYEVPTHPNMRIDTEGQCIDEIVLQMYQQLEEKLKLKHDKN